MARRHRTRIAAGVRSVCCDVFLALWVGSIVLRAAAVLFAPFARFVDTLAVTLLAAFHR